MKIQKLAFLAAFLFTVAALLGGCAPKQQSTSSVPKVEKLFVPDPITVKNSGEERIIHIALRGEDKARERVLSEIADKYRADFPNTTFEFFSVENEEELKSLLHSGREIDLCELEGGEEYSLAREDVLANLTVYLSGWNESDTLTGSARSAIEAMGDYNTAYLIPNDYSHDLLFYRADWFGDYEETGIRVPRVWGGVNEEGEMAQATRRLAEHGSGLIFGGREKLLQIFNAEVWSSVVAGRMADSSAAYFSGRDPSKSIFTLDQAVNGVAEFLSVMQGVPEEALSWTEEEAVRAFEQGQAAMLLADQGYWARLQESMGDAVGVTNYPRGISGTALMTQTYRGWSVVLKEGMEDAVHFLLYLSNADNNTHYAKECGAFPIHQVATDMKPSLLEGEKSRSFQMLKISEQYQFAFAPRMYGAWEPFREQAYEKLCSSISGELSQEELLSWLDEYWNEAYEQEGQLWDFGAKDFE